MPQALCEPCLAWSRCGRYVATVARREVVHAVNPLWNPPAALPSGRAAGRAADKRIVLLIKMHLALASQVCKCLCQMPLLSRKALS